MNKNIIDFFENSDRLDELVTRQLEHIKPNWELTWNHLDKIYETEDDSCSSLINELIIDLAKTKPLEKYHSHEDMLVEYCKKNLGWKITKEKNRWVGENYSSILEQGSFNDINQENLVLAITGRIQAAIYRKQYHFDSMEEFHRNMLADLIAIYLYHRLNDIL